MQRPRLLIVDSQRAIAHSLCLVFEREGYDVRIAESGEAALKIAESWQPDVTIAGMILARLNGLDYACRLARMYPQCRVILAAAQVASNLVEEARLAGFDFYYYPVHPRVLIARVKAMLAEGDPSIGQQAPPAVK